MSHKARHARNPRLRNQGVLFRLKEILPPGRDPFAPRSTLRHSIDYLDRGAGSSRSGWRSGLWGTVSLSATLKRIQEGRLLSFRNDGTVFQNREKRLPNKPSGHYREYVHPTPNLGGPGPRRVVKGNQGEYFYTPDHYRTFRKLNR